MVQRCRAITTTGRSNSAIKSIRYDTITIFRHPLRQSFVRA
jgi:hypothetical protein